MKSFLASAALTASMSGALLAAPPAPVALTPEQTRREFQQMCQDLRNSDDPYYGMSQIWRLRAALAKPGDDYLTEAGNHAQLGLDLLRIGDALGAVDQFQAARKLTIDHDMAPLYRLDAVRKLGLAYLRLGEQTNCVGMHTPASCILPITAQGVHSDKTGARAAEREYLEFLEENPQEPTVRWLLNVAAMTAGDYPAGVPENLRIPPDTFESAYDIRKFPDIAGRLGVDVRDSSGGAIVDDFDNDGYLDIVTSTIDPCGPMHYFHNDGRGGFQDWSDRSGLSGQLGGLNIIQADYNNDGQTDILVLRGGWLGEDGRMRNSLLRNNGDGTFTDVTAAAGLAVPSYPTQTAAWADYDGDGWLDLYVGNESSPPQGRDYPSQLFHNNGDGTFTDVAARAGVTNDRFAKAVVWGDYDNDGRPDLYVSNIGPNRLYHNNGDGTFTDLADRMGVTEPAGRSFTAWFFDYDNDGWLDIFVGDYGATSADVHASYEGLPHGDFHPRLYHNEHGRAFRDVSRQAGLDRPSLPMGGNFGDLDGDGWPDFYLGTGLPDFESIAPNLMYRNVDGERFVDVSFSGGFANLQKGHGVAFADLDNDGDQDVYEQMGGAYPGDAYGNVLYENPGHGTHWLRLKLVGTRANRCAIGARIRVTVETPRGRRGIYWTVGSGGSFGGNPLECEIGLGDASRIDSVEVRWPRGDRREVFRGLDRDRAYELEEGAGKPREVRRTAVRFASGAR
jgi:hypothetical protein